MSSLFAPIYEQRNDQRLQELKSKVSILKDITLDIHKQASDMTVIDQGKEAISRLSQNVKASALRLSRVFLAKTSIFKYVCLFVLTFTILWILSGFF